jgi:hypothetical protein
MKRIIPALIALSAVAAGSAHAALRVIPEISAAMDRLYNFDFQGTHATLDRYIASHPGESLPYAMRASAYLFFELDRLGILESQFFASDRRIADKKGSKPDPVVRAAFLKAVNDAETLASATLASHPNDENALFAMAVTLGVMTDYTAFVEKKQFGSLSPAKRSNTYAQRLLRVDPNFCDAYVTAGLSEYLVGSLPFFIRWFVHFDGVSGSKERGVEQLQRAAREGSYLRSFAKILLGLIYLREKKPGQTRQLLAELVKDYPENALFRKELARFSTADDGSPQ